MTGNFRVHGVAAGLLALVAGVILVFWAYPRLLIYLLLLIVAVLAYGALYLIVAAWMDPKEEDEADGRRPAPPGARDADATLPDVRPPSGARRTATRRSAKDKAKDKPGATDGDEGEGKDEDEGEGDSETKSGEGSGRRKTGKKKTRKKTTRRKSSSRKTRT